MAGLAGTCSHVGAVLHWVEVAVCMNLSTTCTSKENTWLMPTLMERTPSLEQNKINFSVPKRANYVICQPTLIPIH